MSAHPTEPAWLWKPLDEMTDEEFDDLCLDQYGRNIGDLRRQRAARRAKWRARLRRVFLLRKS